MICSFSVIEKYALQITDLAQISFPGKFVVDKPAYIVIRSQIEFNHQVGNFLHLIFAGDEFVENNTARFISQRIFDQIDRLVPVSGCNLGRFIDVFLHP